MKPRQKPVARHRPTPTPERPVIIAPREVAKGFHGYDTDPEILLDCMIVSGSYDTAIVCRADNCIGHKIDISEEERAAYKAFRRVWSQPTEEETELVLNWARRIYNNTDRRRKADPNKSFAWKKGRIN